MSDVPLEGQLIMWVVYDRPTDYPDKHVARKFVGELASDEMLLADSLDEIRTKVREKLPAGIPIAGFEDDEPQIVEVWL